MIRPNPARPVRRRGRNLVFRVACLALACFGLAQAGEPLRPGATFPLGNQTATLRKLETLPCVESEYTRRFRFDSFDNPKLRQLREQYQLDAVVAPGTNEFQRQILLLDWTHRRFTRFGKPSTNCHGALSILHAVGEGQTFFCAQYAEVLVSASASLGWVCRPLALRRHQGVNQVGGSTEHSVTEIWSNQHRKWVMLDPTANLHLETNGVPLNAWEIRQEWFHRGGTNLTFVVGREQKRYRKADLPIVLGTFPGFGELAVHPDELDKYGFIGYIPNTDLMDSGYDYAGMFISRDALCDGTKWHVRKLPENPAVDPYFPLGQSALDLQVDGGMVRVGIRTLTPNLLRFELRVEGGPWMPRDNAPGVTIPWALHHGLNRLEVRTVNRFGVPGPVATAEIDVRPR